MKDRLRIAIPIIGGKHWLGGITYVNALASALRSLPEHERPFLQLIVRPHDVSSLPYHLETLDNFDGVILIGGATVMLTSLPARLKTIAIAGADSLARETDFYYPVNCDVLPDICSASWIPDFQHVHLPQFFSAQEIQSRNEHFARVAKFARVIVFSSRNAEQDFKLLYPDSRAKTRVVHFHSAIDSEIFKTDVKSIQQLYRTPSKYVICCNQFWKHKNHLLLFEALAALRDQGEVIPLICTGSTEDYRFASYFQAVRETLSRLKLNDQVSILGAIPRNHQLQLLRSAALLIQPSLFEGWSTVVEDGRALGKQMLLSDLDVHREQATTQTEYFSRNSLEDLRSKLSTIWRNCEAGPDLDAEWTARSIAVSDKNRFASDLMELASDSIRLFSRSHNHTSHTTPQSAPNLKYLLDSLLA